MCVPVAAKDLGCTVACCSDGARSPRPSQVCEGEHCWGGAAACRRAGGGVSGCRCADTLGGDRGPDKRSDAAACRGLQRGGGQVLGGDPALCQARPSPCGAARDLSQPPSPAERGSRASPDTVRCLFNSIRLPASFSLVYCNIGRVFIYLILYSVITIVG